MVIEAIRSMGNADLIGCLDAKATQREILGIPIESETAEALQKMLRAGAKAMVAIGDNALRERLTRQLYELGFQFATPIAASAYVSPSEIGRAHV